MSESLAAAVIVILDTAVVGFLVWMMAHPRQLTAHVAAVRVAPER